MIHEHCSRSIISNYHAPVIASVARQSSTINKLFFYIRPLSKLASEDDLQEISARRRRSKLYVHEPLSTEMSSARIASGVEFRKRSITPSANYYSSPIVAIIKRKAYSYAGLPRFARNDGRERIDFHCAKSMMVRKSSQEKSDGAINV
jgi:hypothetical protein